MKSETIRDNSTRSRKTQTLKQGATQRTQRAGNPDEAPIPSKLIIKFGREMHLGPVDTIDYVESVKRKVFVHADAGVFQMYSTMKDIMAKLPASFIRCHNSFLVNSARIATVSSLELALGSGAKVPVSKRYAKEVRAQLRELGV